MPSTQAKHLLAELVRISGQALALAEAKHNG